MLAAKASGTPYIVTAMGLAPVRLRRNLRGAAEGVITLFAYPRLYRSARSVVAISSYVGDWVRGFAKVEPQVILLGAKEPNVDRYVRPGSRDLLYVGEISRRKGIGPLLGGLRLVPLDVSLDLVGAGDLASFRNLSRRLGIAGRVRFHGPVPELRLWEMYAEAFCTVSASLWEGFGLPLVEGFRVGRPAIARRQGGLQEIVETSGAGVLFEDTGQLGTRVDIVTEQWESLSNRAVDFARKHTWRETFGAYRQLFNRTLGINSKEH
jgi:glycosyltransferase involved in cell wall biosynthesis